MTPPDLLIPEPPCLRDEPDVWAFLNTTGLQVTTATSIHPDLCGYCESAPAAVRVYGDPHPRDWMLWPLELEECCVVCAPWLVSRALAEQSDRSLGPIRVEVDAGVYT